MNTEERLEEIETRIAYQERAIDEFGASLGALQDKVRQLESAMRHLAERRAAAGDSRESPAPEDERPPHY